MQLDQFWHGEFDYEVKVFTKEHGTGNAYFRKYHTSIIRDLSYLHNHYMIFRDTMLFQLGNHLKTAHAVKYGGVDTLMGKEIREPGYNHTPPPPPLPCYYKLR